MTTDRTVVQFVCIETPLPRPEFVPSWAPIARTLLTHGMRRSILSERVTRPGPGPAFDFIARNQWPEEAFARAALAHRIGNGDDSPFRAGQGGTFWVTGSIPSRAEFLLEKVMALLIVPDGDSTTLRRTIVDAVPGTQLFLYGDGVTDRERFDVVAEIYSAPGRGADLAAQLERATASLIDPAASTIAVYREVLTLPPPPPAL
jgi:hypothetical protein